MSGKTVLLTGASGLIGKEAIAPLLDSGFIIEAVSSRKRTSTAHVRWHQADLLDPAATESLFARLKPAYLLHFAWYTGKGYLDSDANAVWANAGMHALDTFHRHGGTRAVFAGTCFEDDIPGMPSSAYSRGKLELREAALRFAATKDFSFGWGRIYYVLGHDEHPHRLTPSLMRALRSDEPFTVTGGDLIRDYMYSKDVAAAFAAFLGSNVRGIVDICSGRGISIKELSLAVARRMGKEHLLEFASSSGMQAGSIVGDNARLAHEVGHTVKNTLETAINAIVTQNDVHPI